MTARKSPGKSRWQAWQWTILAATVAVAFSLLLNIILLGVGLGRYNSTTGRGQLVAGSCAQTPKIDTVLHLCINILSVLILGGSNAAMQCLSAPTRADLDVLHARGGWADVGVSGFRNLRFMSRFRRTLWVVLLCSSLPLHLLYNSVIVSVTTSFHWEGYLVASDFATGPDLNQTMLNSFIGNRGNIGTPAKALDLQKQARAGSLQSMSRDDCIQAFISTPVLDLPAVVMVAGHVPYHTPAAAGTLLGIYTATGSFNNISFGVQTRIANPKSKDGDDDLGRVEIPYTDWTAAWRNPSQVSITGSWSNKSSAPDFSFVDHCLVERVDWLCGVFTLPALQGVVVFANLVKLVCLVLLLFASRQQPLITIGDAIGSFLGDPDASTLASSAGGQTVGATGQRWFRGASARRWTITSTICVVYWLAGIIGLILVTKDNGPPLTGGFNKDDSTVTDPPYLLGLKDNGSPSSTVSLVLIANSFQLVLSIAYFQYNGLITSMLLSREWTNFARYRKALRVSEPQGAQRRTFWLSMPFRYGIPLMAIASLLHWLLSEAIYFQEVSVLEGHSIYSPQQNTPSAYSADTSLNGTFINAEPLLVLVIVAAICMLGVAGLAFRRYARGIPVVRSNSLAISAACHPRANIVEDTQKRLQWGIRGREVHVVDTGFSSAQVEPVDPRSGTQSRSDELKAKFQSLTRRKPASRQNAAYESLVPLEDYGDWPGQRKTRDL